MAFFFFQAEDGIRGGGNEIAARRVARRRRCRFIVALSADRSRFSGSAREVFTTECLLPDSFQTVSSPPLSAPVSVGSHRHGRKEPLPARHILEGRCQPHSGGPYG